MNCVSARVPTFSYPGGKGRLAPTLVSMMPVIGSVYVEPFVGRGNVFFAAAHALDFQSWVINDLNTARFFEALKKRGKTATVPARTPQEYVRQKCLYRLGDYRAELLQPYLSFAGGGYKRGGFGNQRGISAESYALNLRSAAEILSRTRATICAKDWQELDLGSLDSASFVYFDPPYRGADVRAYTADKFDFSAMLRLLGSARFRWMLTEYEQPEYLRTLGKPFCTLSVQLACDREGRKRRTECVWKNY